MMMRLLLLLAAAFVAQPPAIPSSPLVFGVFTARFGSDGAFSLQGAGWGSLGGTWRVDGGVIEVVAAPPPRGCDEKAGRYRFTTDGTHVTLDVVEDACVPRRMILDRSSWRPPEEAP